MFTISHFLARTRDLEIPKRITGAAARCSPWWSLSPWWSHPGGDRGGARTMSKSRPLWSADRARHHAALIPRGVSAGPRGAGVRTHVLGWPRDPQPPSPLGPFPLARLLPIGTLFLRGPLPPDEPSFPLGYLLPLETPLGDPLPHGKPPSLGISSPCRLSLIGDTFSLGTPFSLGAPSLLGDPPSPWEPPAFEDPHLGDPLPPGNPLPCPRQRRGRVLPSSPHPRSQPPARPAFPR